jgi:predicted nuclease with TOPRIM domain
MDMKSMLIRQKELNNTINNEKNELINTNEKLRKELNEITVQYDSLRSTNKKLQEENIKSLNSNIENLLSENKKLQNDRSKLKKNLQIFVAENKECAKYITKLKDELKSLNEKSLIYIKDKEQILNQTRYLSEQNEKLHKSYSNLEQKLKIYENNHVMNYHNLCPIHDNLNLNHNHLCCSNSNMSFNNDDLNEQIYQLESQITFLENKVKELNFQKNGDLNKNKNNISVNNNNKENLEKIIINEKNKCVYNCTEDDTYFYTYKNKCYNSCPNGTKLLDEISYLCIIECSENLPFERKK